MKKSVVSIVNNVKITEGMVELESTTPAEDDADTEVLISISLRRLSSLTCFASVFGCASKNYTTEQIVLIRSLNNVWSRI
jgi:hypothetical protein